MNMKLDLCRDPRTTPATGYAIWQPPFSTHVALETLLDSDISSSPLGRALRRPFRKGAWESLSGLIIALAKTNAGLRWLGCLTISKIPSDNGSTSSCEWRAHWRFSEAVELGKISISNEIFSLQPFLDKGRTHLEHVSIDITENPFSVAQHVTSEPRNNRKQIAHDGIASPISAHQSEESFFPLISLVFPPDQLIHLPEATAGHLISMPASTPQFAAAETAFANMQVGNLVRPIYFDFSLPAEIDSQKHFWTANIGICPSSTQTIDAIAIPDLCETKDCSPIAAVFGPSFGSLRTFVSQSLCEGTAPHGQASSSLHLW